MTAVGWLGIWMLAAGLVLIGFELALIGPRLLRLQRGALALRSVLEREEVAHSDEVQRLKVVLAELDLRLRPFRRVRRLLLHPLTLALMESYRRRRSVS